MVQMEVLNALEVNKDKLKVALDELSNRGESMVCLATGLRGHTDGYLGRSCFSARSRSRNTRLLHRPLEATGRAVLDIPPPCRVHVRRSLSNCTIHYGKDTIGGLRSSGLELTRSSKTAKLL